MKDHLKKLKKLARTILNQLYFFKVSINNLNQFQSYSNLFSQVYHLPIITTGICMKYLLKIALISNGTS